MAQTWLGQGALTRVLTGGSQGYSQGYSQEYSTAPSTHRVLTGCSRGTHEYAEGPTGGAGLPAREDALIRAAALRQRKHDSKNKQPNTHTNKQTPFAAVWVSSQSASAGDALQPTNVATVATCCMHCVAHCVATCCSALRLRVGVVQRRTPAAASVRAGICRPITLAQISQPREMPLT